MFSACFPNTLSVSVRDHANIVSRHIREKRRIEDKHDGNEFARARSGCIISADTHAEQYTVRDFKIKIVLIKIMMHGNNNVYRRRCGATDASSIRIGDGDGVARKRNHIVSYKRSNAHNEISRPKDRAITFSYAQ